MSHVPFPTLINGLRCYVLSTISVRIRPGICRDSTNQFEIRSDANIDLDITVSGAGGLDTGVEAPDQWYAVHVIDGPTVAPSGIFSVNRTAPTLPAGYTMFRRVGYARNNAASNLYTGDYRGEGLTRECFYNQDMATLAILTGGSATGGFADVSAAEFAPPSCNWAQFGAEQSTAGGPDLQIRGKGFGNAANGQIVIPGGVAAGSIPRMAFKLPIQDSTRAIQYQNSAGGGTSNIYLVSYIDDLSF